MNVKNILFKIELKGQGVVNYDSGEQKIVFRSEEDKDSKSMYEKHDNVSYAKKNFYRDECGKLTWKLKISRDALMKAAYEKDSIAVSPNVIHFPNTLYNHIAHPVQLVRGYMFANDKGTIKRKGALTITDAEQICNAKSYMEIHSNNNDVKNVKEEREEGEAKGTGLFKRENVGEITYLSKGNIDLSILQFIPCDLKLDRYSFNPDDIDLYASVLKRHLPNADDMKLSYQQFKTASVLIPELGVKLKEEQVLFLVKQILSRLAATNVKRRGSYAKVESLKIKLVTDSIGENFDNGEWIELNTQEAINNLDFKFEDYYVEQDFETAVNGDKEWEETITKVNSERAAAKLAQKVADAEKKAAKPTAKKSKTTSDETVS
jgi:hypothetical protein